MAVVTNITTLYVRHNVISLFGLIMAAAAPKSNTSQLKKAATTIKNAKALIITAGAGMGVDSGLPDYRGPEGFWKGIPPI